MFFFQKKKKSTLNINELLNKAEDAFNSNIKTTIVDNLTLAIKDHIKAAIDHKGFKQKKTLSLSELEEFSPLTCHFIKNQVVGNISKELYNKTIKNDTDLRFYEVVKDIKEEVQYMYININDQVPLSDDSLKERNVVNASQLVETFKIPVSHEEKEFLIEIPIYIGTFVYKK